MRFRLCSVFGRQHVRRFARRVALVWYGTGRSPSRARLSRPRVPPTGSVHSRRRNRGPPAAIASNRNGRAPPIKHPSTLLSVAGRAARSCAQRDTLLRPVLLALCLSIDWEARVSLSLFATSHGWIFRSVRPHSSAGFAVPPQRENTNVTRRRYPRMRHKGQAQWNTAKKKKKKKQNHQAA